MKNLLRVCLISVAWLNFSSIVAMDDHAGLTGGASEVEQLRNAVTLSSIEARIEAVTLKIDALQQAITARLSALETGEPRTSVDVLARLAALEAKEQSGSGAACWVSSAVEVVPARNRLSVHDATLLSTGRLGLFSSSGDGSVKMLSTVKLKKEEDIVEILKGIKDPSRMEELAAIADRFLLASDNSTYEYFVFSQQLEEKAALMLSLSEIAASDMERFLTALGHIQERILCAGIAVGPGTILPKISAPLVDILARAGAETLDANERISYRLVQVSLEPCPPHVSYGSPCCADFPGFLGILEISRPGALRILDEILTPERIRALRDGGMLWYSAFSSFITTLVYKGKLEDDAFKSFVIANISRSEMSYTRGVALSKRIYAENHTSYFANLIREAREKRK